MEQVKTYYDFAENSRKFLERNFRNIDFDDEDIEYNDLCAGTQKCIERYLKHLLNEFASFANVSEKEKNRIMQSHSLHLLANTVRKELDVTFSKETSLYLQAVNGYYFSASYPGENSAFVTAEDIETCKNALEIFVKEYEPMLERLQNRQKRTLASTVFQATIPEEDLEETEELDIDLE